MYSTIIATHVALVVRTCEESNLRIRRSEPARRTRIRLLGEEETHIDEDDKNDQFAVPPRLPQPLATI